MWKTVSVVIVVLSVAALGWAWANREPEKPENSEKVAEIKELAKAAFDEEKKEEPFEERVEKFKQMGKLAETLTKDQIVQLADMFIPMMMKRRQEEVEKFFELPADEQLVELDKKIDEMEKWRAFGQQRRKEREEAAKAPDSEGQADASGSENGGQRRGPWGKFSKEDRENMRRKFMDMTSPKARAQFQEYFRMLNERRKDRGLPEMRGWGG